MGNSLVNGVYDSLRFRVALPGKSAKRFIAFVELVEYLRVLQVLGQFTYGWHVCGTVRQEHSRC